MAQIKRYRSTVVILPFERGGIERRRLGMAPRRVALRALDEDLQEMMSRPDASMRIGSFIVAKDIENDLLVKIRVGQSVHTNGLVSAALLKQIGVAGPGVVCSVEELSSIVLEVEAERDLILDCGVLASVSWSVNL